MSKKQSLELDLSMLADKIIEYGFEMTDKITEESRKVFEDLIKSIKNSKIMYFGYDTSTKSFGFDIRFSNGKEFWICKNNIEMINSKPYKIYNSEISFMGIKFYPLKKEIRKLYKFLFKLYRIMRKNLKLKEE